MNEKNTWKNAYTNDKQLLFYDADLMLVKVRIRLNVIQSFRVSRRLQMTHDNEVRYKDTALFGPRLSQPIPFIITWNPI